MSYFFRYSVDTLASSRTDPTITNSWGVVAANDTIWVAHAVAGGVGRYNLNGTRKGKDIVLPTDRMGAISRPSGLVENFTTLFEITNGGLSKGAFLLIAGLNGVIMAYNPLISADNAYIVVDKSADIILNPPVYTGIAVGDQFIYAADFHNKRIDVYNTNFQEVSDPNGTRFVDPAMPDRMSPINIVNIGGFMFVLYTLQKDQNFPQGAGDGYINVFNQEGVLLKRFVSRGVLEAPWAMLYTPNCFGFPLGALLVGNQKNGRVNAFDRQGNHLGFLIDRSGEPVTIPGLWGLAKVSQTTDSIYFAAGPVRETTGLFGKISRILRLPRFYENANPTNVSALLNDVKDNTGSTSTNLNLIDVGNNPNLQGLLQAIADSGVLNNYSLNDVLRHLIKSGRLNNLISNINNTNCGPNGCTGLINNLELMEALRTINTTPTTGCCGVSPCATKTCKPNPCRTNTFARGLQISNGDGTFRNADGSFLQAFADGSILDAINNPDAVLGATSVESESSTANLITRLAGNLNLAGIGGNGFNRDSLLQYLIACGLIRQCDPCDPCCNPSPCKKKCSPCSSSNTSSWGNNNSSWGSTPSSNSWGTSSSSWGNTNDSWANTSDPWANTSWKSGKKCTSCHSDNEYDS